MELKNKNLENVIWFLGDLSGYESNDIESDDFEVGCNDDQFFTVSIVDLASDAHVLLKKMRTELMESLETFKAIYLTCGSYGAKKSVNRIEKLLNSMGGE